MNAEQTIILTALPRGIGETVAGKTQLLLSVFVSPRLKMNPPPSNGSTTILDNFPDFKDWPQTLSKLHFRVKLDNNMIDETNGVSRDVAAPQSGYWTALFQPSTLVQPYDFAKEDMSGTTVRSVPVMNILTFIKERYGNSGAKHASPTRCTPQVLPRIDYPVVGRLFGPEWFGLITTQSRNAARMELNKQLAANGAYLALKIPNPALEFLQVSDFHQSTLYTSAGPKPAVSEPENVFDFHQMLSSLSEYPYIMRHLGLVVDLTIAVQSVPQSGRVGVEISGPGLTAQIVTPFTLYEFDATRKRFAAAPKDKDNSDVRDGLLRLDREDIYGIAQVDVDGVAIKAINYVEQMMQASNNASTDTPTKSPLPSLRSAGISLVRTNHAAELIKSADNAAAYNKLAEAGEEITLAAEDILSGYRVDVRDLKDDGAKGPWRSLCRRKGTYQFLNAPAPSVPPFEDEGMASVAVTDGPGKQDPNKPQSVKLSEMLFRWAGWSLTVSKDVCSADDLYKSLPTEATNSFGFRAKFDLPDTSDPTAREKRLPRLRFGNKYQLRVRTVDLAGNSLPPEDTTEMTTKDAVTYGRFEPLSWPTVILREAVVNKIKDSSGKTTAELPIAGKEGESVDRLVLRSQPDTDFKQPVLNERHIVPSRISQEIAETHGMFDKDEGTGISKECFKLLDEKNGTLPEVFPGAQIKLPYLPDPLARGVTFLGLPGSDTYQVPYWSKNTKWPDLEPFRLQVVGVPARTPTPQSPLEPPEFTQKNGERVLTVRLPQAEIVRVRLSTYLSQYGDEEINDASELLKKAGPIFDKLGMWQWIDEWINGQGASSSDTEQWKHNARLIILAGLHWIITPYHDVLLVHAVKQPLREPELNLQAQKPNEKKFATFARLSGEIKCDAKSTGKLDVLAEWKEPRDDTGEPAPHASPTQAVPAGMLEPITGSAHVFEVPINLPEFLINQPDLIPAQLDLIHGGEKLATMNVSQGVLTLTSQELRHEFGDTKYRRVNYTAIATTRFREYFPPSNPQTPDERKKEQAEYARVSKEQPLHVLSSARPEAPKVLYIIPAFRWEKSTGQSKRHGGGLRVYMERGWYSSGDGELLGVVLMSNASASTQPPILGDADPLQPYISQWGADPVRVSAGTNGLLAFENFTNAVTSSASGNFQTTGLSLDELPDVQVSVVPHAVAYDEVRRLWYCDIEINPGNSYFPFVRLALARYQPNSVQGVQLSRVVLADFVQLTPERTLSVVALAGDPKSLNITVTGPTYSHYKGKDRMGIDRTIPEATSMSVQAQQQTSDSELSWQPVEQIFQPKALLLNYEQSQQSWTGKIVLPEIPGAPGSKKYRLVISEEETLLNIQDEPQNRVVYADVVYL